MSEFDDLTFENDDGLEGFLSGESAGTVNLQPSPVAFGNSIYTEDGASSKPPSGNMSAAPPDVESGNATATAASAAAAAAATAAVAGAAATALMSGKFSDAHGILGSAAAGVAGDLAAKAVPTSLVPVKESAGRFLSKAQPWREFLLPLSIPTAAEGCSRLTANLYYFQTNYAILFVVQLVITILLQPSALFCIVGTILAWMAFLKKNEDPNWKPVVGGVELGPMQRWLALAVITAILLLCVAGGTIFSAALMFVMGAAVHGVIHDASAKGIPGVETNPPVPL
eukprot:gnl/TRDRNA2_/TRDRNA2_196705_c0_seq1.p1 gnl/TRDRNA2_/TRDRNA2_196705_c0~~gnl/TRDRNA2_/TRDRNA2_196705_c0_seq1.p1  ORF type:complete len:283 (+),score=57.58 gnl/TRDRNA2_/TRDRNA2_196705_c0_seq1:97-945(+)